MFSFLSKIKSIFSRRAWKEKYEKYERHISSVALISGFIIDTLTLSRIDRFFETFVFFGYLFLASTGIILVNLAEQNRLGEKPSKFHTLFLVVIQFSFGALFSGFTVFYFRSASLTASWPFILFLLALLVGNEFFRTRYQKLVFQISILFVAIFSLSIFYVPIITKTLGVGTFIVSGSISLVIIGLFLFVVSCFLPNRIYESKKTIAGSILGIFVIINIFYFTNIIPPIPLSLKDVGVFHNVSKKISGYEVIGEDRSWYEFLFPFQRISLMKEKPIYVLSSVFAPTNLNTNIVHNWQYFDEGIKRWVSVSKIEFAIEGGADGGYRGYSQKTNLFTGYWRVDIETPRGQVIGRIRFKIVEVKDFLRLETKKF